MTDCNGFASKTDIKKYIMDNWPETAAGPDFVDIAPLAGDGSERRFWRVKIKDVSAIFLQGPDAGENRSYELIGRHIWKRTGLSPEFLAVDLEKGFFLMEDLGDLQLYGEAGRADSESRLKLYGKVVEILAKFHDECTGDFDTRWCFQTERYDANLILERETSYFLSAFVNGYSGMNEGLSCCNDEFQSLAEAATSGRNVGIMHRDFQSRNIMIKEGRPRIIDFQGARLGPPGYDLASLLYDPYVGLNREERDRLLGEYADIRERNSEFDRDSFMETYPYLGVCRLLQALGAFGFLTRVKNKSGFEEHIPTALKSLNQLLESDSLNNLAGLRNLVQSVGNKMEI